MDCISIAVERRKPREGENGLFVEPPKKMSKKLESRSCKHRRKLTAPIEIDSIILEK